METLKVPDHLIYPMRLFADDMQQRIADGLAAMKTAKVAFVGLARDCGHVLERNLGDVLHLSSAFREWCLHIEENDSADNTVQLLRDFCAEHRQATFTSRSLGRKRYSNEFAGRRTIALGEYRTACQQWVRDCAANSDYVVMIDWDQYGWSQNGLVHGFGSLANTPDAYGMASVSLLESRVVESNGKDVVHKRGWLHYDTWTLRINTWWDDYTAGQGGWKHQWLPPVGSPVIPVLTAFGGLAIYRTADWLQGTYDGREDCEHVALHRTIQAATGKRLYLNPTQRSVMQFLPPDAAEATDGRHDSHD